MTFPFLFYKKGDIYMSNKMLCDIADLVAIADVTRSLNGSSDKYYLDELVTEVQNVAKTVEQATPSISVDSNGKITSTATQNVGFVKGGSKTATKQLSTQGTQVITPGTYDKTIPSGKYLTGTQTIKGDYNLIPENIREGVSIFGVYGEMSEGGSSSEGEFVNIFIEYTYSDEIEDISETKTIVGILGDSKMSPEFENSSITVQEWCESTSDAGGTFSWVKKDTLFIIFLHDGNPSSFNYLTEPICTFHMDAYDGSDSIFGSYHDKYWTGYVFKATEDMNFTVGVGAMLT